MRPHRLLVLAALLAATATADATPPLVTAAPPGMVLVPAGLLERGRDDAVRRDERPRARVAVAAFALDATLVTRADFARFVAATGFVTTAERIGFGMGAREGMADWQWERMPRASWRRPFVEGTAGSAAFLADDAPVVLVTWDDAKAFCQHAGKRLPTEAEWEHAMRAGARGTRYPWGEGPLRDGKLALNFWQGASHARNSRADGHLYVSPVRAFPPNAWGIYDAVGNVWQWTADWYAPDTYARGAPPAAGTLRVLRGGSWWCGSCACEGNGLHHRGKARPDAPYNNNGFRCAADVAPR